MSLTKVNYIDNSTIIGAQNLNDIQDNIIQNSELIKKVAPRNLLDNSDFQNPVNQRGQTSYTDKGYTIDRWKLENCGDNGISVSPTGIALNETTTTLVFQQSLADELKNRLIGKNITLAVTDADNNIYVATNITPELESSGSVVAVAIASDLTSDVYYSSSTKQLRVRLVTHKMTSSITISNIALYEGEYTIDTLPKYQPKGYGVELAECMRYYQKLPRLRMKGNTGYIPIRLAVPMRIAPSITFVNSSNNANSIETDYNGFGVVANISSTADTTFSNIELSADL